jgi:hypothetical protein
MMTPSGYLHDAGALGTARSIGKALSQPAYIRKLGWLIPRMMRAMPYLGYVVVGGTRM